MLTFEKWLDEWKIDSDYEPTVKDVDAMRDAWDGAIQTMRDAVQKPLALDLATPCFNCTSTHEHVVCSVCGAVKPPSK